MLSNNEIVVNNLKINNIYVKFNIILLELMLTRNERAL